MSLQIAKALENENVVFTKNDLLEILSFTGDEQLKELFKVSTQVKHKYVGNSVYLRGLVELSNICQKDCLYCGIRKSHTQNRYEMSDEEVIKAAEFAFDRQLASMVIQSGERQDEKFISRIERLLKQVRYITGPDFGITLSCGEQSYKTYKKWFDAGANRYLLRIESTNQRLFKMIHPDDGKHSYETRMECLHFLKDIGYQTGTGVMIGLPTQTLEDLADDLLFFRDFDIHMVGMGPFLEHPGVPLYHFKDQVPSKHRRYELSLIMIAALRILMKDINIASTTALETIKLGARDQGLMIGANVMMPNLTPHRYRESYLLYSDKSCLRQELDQNFQNILIKAKELGMEVCLGRSGDSLHFSRS